MVMLGDSLFAFGQLSTYMEGAAVESENYSPFAIDPLLVVRSSARHREVEECLTEGPDVDRKTHPPRQRFLAERRTDPIREIVIEGLELNALFLLPDSLYLVVNSHRCR